MSTLVAARYDNGVVIGSDYLNKNPHNGETIYGYKLWPIENAVVGFAGDLPENFARYFCTFANFPDTKTKFVEAMIKLKQDHSTFRIHGIAVTKDPIREIHFQDDNGLHSESWGSIGAKPSGWGPPKPQATVQEQVAFVLQYLIKAKFEFPNNVGWLEKAFPQILICPDNSEEIHEMNFAKRIKMTWNEFKKYSESKGAH